MEHTFLALILLIAAAKVGGSLAVRFRQPAVLGELAAGLVLGNLGLLGLHSLDFLKTDLHLAFLAELGVIFLLFEVGLQSNLRDMMRVGPSAFLVAVVGVIAPMALGYVVTGLLVPHTSFAVPLFLGATLSATSVGITARVFQDLGRSGSREAQVVLGAAVIDDVLGLIVLAAVGGIIGAANGAGTLSTLDLGLIVGKAGAFLVAAVMLGAFLSPRLFAAAFRLRSEGVLLACGLFACFLFSLAASRVGLAPIVGSFAAGLVLEPVHYKRYLAQGDHELEELVRPLTSFLVPIFFVLMGIKVDLSSLAQPGVVLLALALTVVGALGKQVCGLAVLGRGMDRLTVGLGMIPRGEVGLIFANIGLGLTVAGEPVLTKASFSAVVIMVMLTTLMTPPLLNWSLSRWRTHTADAGVAPEPALGGGSNP